MQETHSHDAFRDEFKFYKRKQPPPDLSAVIDFRDVSSFSRHGVQQVAGNFVLDSSTAGVNGSTLRPANTWEIYQLDQHPGLFFIPNPFTSDGVEYWISRSLKSYCQPPNPTNLKDQQLDSSLPDFDNVVLQRLRWATLGYHHNWDTKEYSEDNKGDFPYELQALSSTIAQCVGFQHFKAEAAIVNYYALDSSIGGHTDHSEKDHRAPLLSFSFGQTAIFLVGTECKSVKPSAMFIRNGDIVVMSGSTRLSYHAVPKILADPDFTIGGRWSNVMSKMRLNINVRQVNFSNQIF